MISWEKKKTPNQKPALFHSEIAPQLILEKNITDVLFKIPILRDNKISWELSGYPSVVYAVLSRYLHRSGRSPKPPCPRLAALCQDLWRQKPLAGATRPHLRGTEQARAFAVPWSCLTAGTDMPWTSWREKTPSPSCQGWPELGEPGKQAGSCLLEKSCRGRSIARVHLEEAPLTQLRQPQRLSQLLAMRGAAQHLDPGFSLQISPLGKAGGIQHLGQPHLSGLTQA